MSRPKVSTTPDRQKIALAILLLLVVGYSLGRPSLEKWLGQPLPGFGNDRQSGESTGSPGSSAGGTSGDPSVRSGAGTASRKSPDLERHGDRTDSARGTPSENGFFVALGRDQLQSPAGLVYGMGANREHRLDHVLRHAEDDPSRPVHGVFEGSREEILQMIDEAWSLAQKGGRGVQASESDGQSEYTVRLDRNTGYEGGQSGKRNNHPRLQRIRLVVQDGNRIITAFPCR